MMGFLEELGSVDSRPQQRVNGLLVMSRIHQFTSTYSIPGKHERFQTLGNEDHSQD